MRFDFSLVTLYKVSSFGLPCTHIFLNDLTGVAQDRKERKDIILEEGISWRPLRFFAFFAILLRRYVSRIMQIDLVCYTCGYTVALWGRFGGGFFYLILKNLIFVPVKRLAGILFISIYMLAFAEFHQLLRIPFLIEHYNFHQQTDPGISFMKFLNMHYLGPIIVDDDFTKDQQLPFRDVDCHTMIGSLVFSSEPPSFTIDPPVNTAAEFYNYDEVNKPQFEAFDIFQPPRRA